MGTRIEYACMRGYMGCGEVIDYLGQGWLERNLGWDVKDGRGRRGGGGEKESH